MIKKAFFIIAALLVFTEGLIFLHNSRFEKNEYDTICHSIYDEKVWIDTCYYPYNSEIKTFEMARNIELVGIAAITLLHLKKLYLKN